MLYRALASQILTEAPPAFVDFDDGLSGPVYAHGLELYNGHIIDIYTVDIGQGWRSFTVIKASQ